MTQLSFDDLTYPLEAVMAAEGKPTPAQKVETFQEWVRLNPDALRLMYDHAMLLYGNRRHFSIKYLMEWLRYEGGMELESTADGVAEDEYKLPNAYAPIIARLFVERKPELLSEIQLNKSEFDEVDLSGVVW